MTPGSKRHWVLVALLASAACGNDGGGQNGSQTSHVLTVQKAGAGSGTVTGGAIACGSTCSGSVAHGTVVTLTATADASSKFASWAGCDSTDGTNCIVSMDGEHSVTVRFEAVQPATYTLTVHKTGSGSGTVTGGPIACGSTCSAPVAPGTVVVLTAAPDGGATASWSGCGSATGSSCSVTMDADRVVTVAFAAATGCTAGATRQCSEGANGQAVVWPLGRPVGICSYGSQTCSVTGGVGTWGACAGAVGAAARDCQSTQDNDCNGAPDNAKDGVCQCQPSDPTTCTGNPAFPASTCPGTRTCQITSASSTWGPCNGPEACGCTSPQACTAGACEGTRPCTNGQLGACEAGGQALPDDCECQPAQTVGCETLGGVNTCGTATCTAAFVWNPATCSAPTQYCQDADGDGHGNPNLAQSACSPPAGGYVPSCDDCDDTDATKYPGAACGLSGFHDPFLCTTSTQGATCSCTDARCSYIAYGGCRDGLFGAECNHDSATCPSGYMVSCGPCRVTSGSGTCDVTERANESCRLHQEVGTAGHVGGNYDVVCSLRGP